MYPFVVMAKDTDISMFFYELGMLRRVQREGWKLLGVMQPESVAEHSLRAAQIAYVLAILEHHPSPETVCSILVFHDIGECRIGDIQKVANRYITADEKSAVSDQLRPLDEIGNRILMLWDQIGSLNTSAGIIAKDADLLELAITASEYKRKGFTAAEDWVHKTEQRLQTLSAKNLFASITQTDPMSWWDALKQLEKHRRD